MPRGRPPAFDETDIDNLVRWIYRWRYTVRPVIKQILGVKRLSTKNTARIFPYIERTFLAGWSVYYLSPSRDVRTHARSLFDGAQPRHYRFDPLALTLQELDHEIGIQTVLFDHYRDAGAVDALPPRWLKRSIRCERIPDAWLPESRLAVEYERSDKGAKRCFKAFQQCHHTMGTSAEIDRWDWHFSKEAVRRRYIDRYARQTWPRYRPNEQGRWVALQATDGSPRLIAPVPRVRDRIRFL